MLKSRGHRSSMDIRRHCPRAWRHPFGGRLPISGIRTGGFDILKPCTSPSKVSTASSCRPWLSLKCRPGRTPPQCQAREGATTLPAGDRSSRRGMNIPETITALTAIGALVFTALSLNTTRDQVAAAYQQNAVAQQGQYTDRYIRAVEQLDQSGSIHLQGRLGGIYALERLADDSPRDQPAIIETLSAFIRTSRTTLTPAPTAPQSTCPPPQPLAHDVQAALTVLGRRNRAHDNNTFIDLTNTCLNGTDLSSLNLRGSNLSGADLTGSALYGANLSGVVLEEASLYGANLRYTVLTGADMRNADLRAYLEYGNLHGAHLESANLRDAKLYGADLRGASLRGAYLYGADLREVIHNNDTATSQAMTDVTTVGRWW
jgi:Pentapeptide repeats (8 copies)